MTRIQRHSRTVFAACLLAGTAFATAPALADQGGALTTEDAPHVGLPDFTELAKYVSPAVVSITTKLAPDQPAEASQQVPAMPFPGFPGFPGFAMPSRPQVVEARGSGFIIKPDGYIVTNNHVVKDARSITVTMSDGAEYPAKLIGHDPRTDLALLKIAANHPLRYLTLGDSAKVEPGAWIIAVGNPFGLGGTITAGIVSARGRDIGAGPYDDFIQVDAPINRGNSGGPLITQDGKVVGVNSAIISPDGGSVGIGFAIPSNTVRTVVTQLEQSGHVTRGYLGVAAQIIRPDMARALNLPSNGTQPAAGALVASVEADSPAAKAGIAPGDVILAVNGNKVTNPHDLAVDIAAIPPGDTAHLAVLHDGHSAERDARVTSLSDDTDDGTGGQADHTPNIGLALQAITPDMRNQLNLSGSVHGAVVSEVQPGSPAEAAGIQQGDVIVGVGSENVAGPDQAVAAIRRALRHAGPDGGHSLALRVLRNGQTAFIALDLGAQGDGGNG